MKINPEIDATIKKELLKELEKLDGSFPKFCKLAKTAINYSLTKKEEANLRDNIDALIRVKQDIDKQILKTGQDIDKQISDYVNVSRDIEYRDNYHYTGEVDKVSAVKREEHYNKPAAMLNKAWTSIAERKMKPKEAEKLYIEMGREIDGKVTYEQLVDHVVCKTRTIQFPSQGSYIAESTKKITNAAAKARMKDIDNKMVKTLTKKIFTEKEGAAGVLQLLKEIPNSAMSRLSKKIATENVRHNLFSSEVEIGVGGATGKTNNKGRE